MTIKTSQKLLKNKNVIDEINRHRWIESERAGQDIGFERASSEWLEKFSKAWMQYHMPKRKKTTSKSPSRKKTPLRKPSKKSKSRTRSKAKIK